MPTRKLLSEDVGDDFVSFAALHTSVFDEKGLKKAPRPSFTCWDYDPTRRPLSATQSQRKDEEVARSLTYRLNKLTSDLLKPSTIDRKLRQNLKKNKEKERTSSSDAAQLPRSKSLNGIDSKPITPSEFEDDVSVSSKRLGTKMEELRNMISNPKQLPLGFFPESYPESQCRGSHVINETARTGSGSHRDGSSTLDASSQLHLGSYTSRDIRYWLESDPSAELYTSSFSVNVLNPQKPQSKPTNYNEIRARTPRLPMTSSNSVLSNHLTTSQLQENGLKTMEKNSGKDEDTSAVISGVLTRLRNPPPTRSMDKYSNYLDDGSRAELEAFAAQIGDLSLPAHMEKGSRENFWVRMGHSKGELAQLQQLVDHTFDKSRRYQTESIPGFELRTPELELFPTAQLAKRYAQDRLNSTK